MQSSGEREPDRLERTLRWIATPTRGLCCRCSLVTLPIGGSVEASDEGTDSHTPPTQGPPHRSEVVDAYVQQAEAYLPL
jgi:hypothetical protein